MVWWRPRGTYNDRMSEMLLFRGSVSKGCHRFHREVTIPGRQDLDSAPSEWPDCFEPGTLNVVIADAGFPAELAEQSMRVLDHGTIPATVVIPAEQITGNTLPPTEARPDRGTGQAWRAELRNVQSGETAACWLFRRRDSGYARVAELIAGQNLRACLHLHDGDAVEIVLIAPPGSAGEPSSRAT